MSEYTDMTLTELENAALLSSPELGSLSGGRMINYETGKPFLVCDEDTAVFIASARSIVLELIRRIRSLESTDAI
jgi:hypothetical protein